MILIVGVVELVGVVLATVEEEDSDVGVDGGEMPAYLDFCVLSCGLWLWSIA